MSTFSKLRIGPKGKSVLAGVPVLTVTVPTDVAEVVGSLPVGAIVLGAQADVASVTATVGTATLACLLVAGVQVDSDDLSAQAAPTITITLAVAGNMTIKYMLPDALDGVNE